MAELSSSHRSVAVQPLVKLWLDLGRSHGGEAGSEQPNNHIGEGTEVGSSSIVAGKRDRDKSCALNSGKVYPWSLKMFVCPQPPNFGPKCPLKKRGIATKLNSRQKCVIKYRLF